MLSVYSLPYTPPRRLGEKAENIFSLSLFLSLSLSTHPSRVPTFHKLKRRETFWFEMRTSDWNHWLKISNSIHVDNDFWVLMVEICIFRSNSSFERKPRCYNLVSLLGVHACWRCRCHLAVFSDHLSISITFVARSVNKPFLLSVLQYSCLVSIERV